MPSSEPDRSVYRVTYLDSYGFERTLILPVSADNEQDGKAEAAQRVTWHAPNLERIVSITPIGVVTEDPLVAD